MTEPVPVEQEPLELQRLLEPGPARDIVRELQDELDRISDEIDGIIEGGFRREDIPKVRQVIRRIRIISGRESRGRRNSNV